MADANQLEANPFELLRPSTLAAAIADIDSSLDDEPFTELVANVRQALYDALVYTVGPDDADTLIAEEAKQL